MKFPHPDLNRQFSSENVMKGIFSVFGGFGTGKTTFALQTALNSINEGQEILFFYSKPNLPVQKFKDVYRGVSNELSIDALDSLKIFTVKNFGELLGISFNLEFLLLDNHEKFEDRNMLVIIDSITDLYKLKLNPKNKKHNVNLNHLLNQILANLHHLNQKYGAEILLVNELSRDKEGKPVLSGGKVMNYWVSYALQLQRTPVLNKREALLSLPGTDSVISFELDLTEKGFRFTQ